MDLFFFGRTFTKHEMGNIHLAYGLSEGSTSGVQRTYRDKYCIRLVRVLQQLIRKLLKTHPLGKAVLQKTEQHTETSSKTSAANLHCSQSS